LRSCSTRFFWICQSLTCLVHKTWPKQNTRSGRRNPHHMSGMVISSPDFIRFSSGVKLLWNIGNSTFHKVNGYILVLSYLIINCVCISELNLVKDFDFC
jgi:hypothetical protein